MDYLYFDESKIFDVDTINTIVQYKENNKMKYLGKLKFQKCVYIHLFDFEIHLITDKSFVKFYS